jgi:hypothetical protein
MPDPARATGDEDRAACVAIGVQARVPKGKCVCRELLEA